MYKRILVPVDGSETSNKALVAALQLAKDAGGRVRLVHVVEELAYLSGYEQFGGYSDELFRVMRETGTKVLNDGMAIAQAAGIEADNLLFDNLGGRLAEVVADAAKQWNADLIVVGTHGRRGVGRMLLGSGAEQIIRLAPMPVLVVRSGEDSGSKAA
ncbi:MAG TPA: universal stress protein [Polaromonas sp.]|uniref:universal stress protein n=1 Tax=Polaromonas sp. UBA4122 TaxID=1947074 RepID=UPI000EDA86A8|nr:universal stress protein [Polaromonas sp. UBA4122]HAL37975.1 universal stress protein [Polaromonas sp.]